jgi:hypothetical protein
MPHVVFVIADEPSTIPSSPTPFVAAIFRPFQVNIVVLLPHHTQRNHLGCAVRLCQFVAIGRSRSVAVICTTPGIRPGTGPGGAGATRPSSVPLLRSLLWRRRRPHLVVPCCGGGGGGGGGGGATRIARGRSSVSSLRDFSLPSPMQRLRRRCGRLRWLSQCWDVSAELSQRWALSAGLLQRWAISAILSHAHVRQPHPDDKFGSVWLSSTARV